MLAKDVQYELVYSRHARCQKKFSLDDDTYRAKLIRITGKQSAKDMTEDERQKVLTVFRNEGFAPASATRRADGRQKLTGKFAKKLQALWIVAWNLGIVRERDDAAFVAFVSRREFERLKACDPATLTDLERAARFI